MFFISVLISVGLHFFFLRDLKTYSLKNLSHTCYLLNFFILKDFVSFNFIIPAVRMC